jgi:uncharacterized repeat protein (TIGR02543 family)
MIVNKDIETYPIIADGTTVGFFTVTFNVNDGGDGNSVNNPPGQIANVANGSLIAEPPRPDRSGYIFGGWFRDSDGLTPWHFITDVITANTVLYAFWTPDTP